MGTPGTTTKRLTLTAAEATDTSIMVDDIAVSNSPDRSSEETRGGDGRRRDTVDADQVRAMTVEAMERIIFGPCRRPWTVRSTSSKTWDGTTRGTDGQGANTRDAGTGAGSVTTHTTATATGVGAGVATGTETVLLARDVDRARSSRHSSSSSASRSHWPGPVQLPEWINEERAPSHFKCPITLCVMREPAVTPAWYHVRTIRVDAVARPPARGAVDEAPVEAFARRAELDVAGDD
jgi:hypothetical protein